MRTRERPSPNTRAPLTATVIIAASLVVVTGCSDPLAPFTVLQTTTVVSPDSIGPADSVLIEVTITNPTSTPALVTTPNSCLAAG
jgi:hypothetical protein